MTFYGNPSWACALFRNNKQHVGQKRKCQRVEESGLWRICFVTNYTLVSHFNTCIDLQYLKTMWIHICWFTLYLLKMFLYKLKGEVYNVIWESLSVTCDRLVVFPGILKTITDILPYCIIWQFSQFSGCWLILSVYIIMSFDFPFVRLFGVR
jgi:hypothetical protein